MSLDLEGRKIIIERVLQKLWAANYVLESQPRTIINIDGEDLTLMLWAVQDYEKNLDSGQGEWIPVDGTSPCDEWDCTACGQRKTFSVNMDVDDMRRDYPRCPKCGAKMRVKEEDHG